ncbi:MAG: c-type cytochrome [Actinomycetales bacterium]|nr:c-type cytochrome [Actinomycetales bacterium]
MANISGSSRRRPYAGAVLLLAALTTTGAAYAVTTSAIVSPKSAAASAEQIELGKRLFTEGCSSCHGLAGQGGSSGPSLIGVGAAAVDFQVGTGRMPMAQADTQAMRKPPVYNQEQIDALAAYVASFGAGPGVPDPSQYDFSNANVARGGEIYRLNCSQCHNYAGKGGALSDGKYAPSVMKATPKQIYEAMITGPQGMPVFSDAQIPAKDKQDIIAYIDYLQNAPDPGGAALGRLGPVTETVFMFTAAIGAVIAVTIWIGAKSR